MGKFQQICGAEPAFAGGQYGESVRWRHWRQVGPTQWNFTADLSYRGSTLGVHVCILCGDSFELTPSERVKFMGYLEF